MGIIEDGLSALDGLMFKDTPTKGDPNAYETTGLGQVIGLIGGASGLFDSDTPATGYQGGIPQYSARRQAVPNTNDPNRRPGSGGQRYFTDMQYTTPTTDTPMSAEGLAAMNAANPARELRKRPEIQQMARGGIATLKEGTYLRGTSDGMADKVPANIDGVQEARLSDGEFVIPADVVSHLGNGNSDAGAKVLQDMMRRIRKTRTGNEKQGKEINPQQILPV
jgi:hypothetical protein